MSASKAIVDFWRLFSERRGALAQINTADDPIYDELLEQLQHISPGLFFEFSAEPDNCELIITAEGERSQRAAPRNRSWSWGK